MVENKQKDTGSSKRFYELDVLRGIAALGVVLFHYTSQYSSLYDHSDEVWFYLGLGRHGVEFFFIMSGFVILITLERIKSSLEFIIKRFARLYPAYWVAVLLTFIVTAIAQLPGLQVSLADGFLNLTMFQWLFNAPNVDKVYWTLRIEICFYAIMLLAYQLKLIKHIEAVVSGWLMLALFYTIKTYMARWGFLVLSPLDYTGSWYAQPPLDSHLMLLGFANNFPNIIEGLRSFIRQIVIIKYAHLFIAGLMLYREKKQGFSIYRWVIIVVCILAQKVAYPWETSWSTTIIVGSFILLLYLATKGYLAFIRLKPLIFLGTISYSLYLIHQNIGYVIIRHLYQYQINPNIGILLALAVALILATTMTFLIEIPANDWIRKKYKERQNKLVKY